mgnify:CR=1 FL=1
MMSDLRKLRGKQIWVYIKQGFTIEDLLEKYKCSQEELEKYMEKNFEKKARDSVRRKLEKNGKKSGNNTAVIVTQEEISKTTLKEIQKKARQMQEKNIMVMKEKENKKDSDEMSLEKLKDRENALVTETCQQEGEHKRTLATRRTLLEKLVTEKEKILELKNIILQRQKEVDEIFTKMVEIDEKITAESEELSANKKILNEVREYIKVLGKVTLFVYENGEIKEEEAEVAEELLESDEVFDSLIHNKLVENLSVKQIRQLSKLMVLTEQMQKQGQNYDLVFESEIVQKIFEQL